MSVILGFIMFCFGGVGSFLSIQYMENDHRYTYKPPLTGHETSVLILFAICLILLAVGLIMTILGILKKRNEDSLQKLMNQTSGNGQKSVCPQCGLNLANGSTECPRCGNVIQQRGGNRFGPNNY